MKLFLAAIAAGLLIGSCERQPAQCKDGTVKKDKTGVYLCVAGGWRLAGFTIK